MTFQPSLFAEAGNELIVVVQFEQMQDMAARKRHHFKEFARTLVFSCLVCQQTILLLLEDGAIAIIQFSNDLTTIYLLEFTYDFFECKFGQNVAIFCFRRAGGKCLNSPFLNTGDGAIIYAVIFRRLKLQTMAFGGVYFVCGIDNQNLGI